MSKPIIMVVDDEKDFADDLTDLVKRTGKYDVLTSYSAKEALEQLRKNKVLWGMGGNKIHLIILDIKMPDMDGLQFLEKVRKDYDESIGVCMLTAWEDEEKWDKATSGFVVAYLTKPLDEDKLIKTLDDYFAGKEGKMVLDTFEEHINKRDELEKKKE